MGFEENGKKKSLKVLILITISLFLCLFISGTVSALDFGIDNYKQFDKNIGSHGQVEVWDRGFFLIDVDNKLSEVELVLNTEYCGEAYGTKCKAIYKITNYEIGNVIQDLRLEKLDKNKEITKDKNDVKITIKNSLEETNETINDKKVYDYSTENPNTYYIELEGYIEKGGVYDHQVKVFGEWITEFAIWNGTSTTGLKLWHTFNNTKTDVKAGETWTTDGTVSYNQNGYFNASVEFDGNNANRLKVQSTANMPTYQAGTVEAWVKTNSIVDNCVGGNTVCGIVSSASVGHSNGFRLGRRGGNDIACSHPSSNTPQWITWDGLEVGTWYHVACTWNATSWNLYINGTLVVDSTLPASNEWTGVEGHCVGVECQGISTPSFVASWNGTIDEVMYFNVGRNTSEIISDMEQSVDFIDTTFPYFIDGTPTNQTIGYGDALAYNINATDETEFGCFEINDTTNFKINCSGYLQNNTLLSAGLYNLNVTINDSSNNQNSSFFWVNVTKGNPATNMAISGTTPIEYGTTSDFSESETNVGDGGCSYSMDRGNEVYGVGTWTFNYSTSGCANYTAGSVTKDLVVNKNDSLVLGLTATTPIEYPATTDFTGSNCPSQLSCSLNISNAIYQVGDISANYSTTGNNNYSATSIDFTVTINQNSSYVLGISGTTPITYGTITNVVGSDCPSQLSCSLNLANDIYGVEVSPLIFNYSTAGNTNYTAGSITKDIIINQAGDTFDVLLNGVLANLTVTFPQQVNVSVSNNLTTATIDVNGTTFTSGDNYTLGGGVWFVNISTTGNQNYTSNESNWYITINKATPTGTLAGTSPITYGTAGNVEGTETNNGDEDLIYQLYREGTLVSNPDNSVLGVGTYNYIYNVSSGQNYTAVASLDTFVLTVDIATGDGTLLLNGSATNYTINRTENVNITATLDTGSGDISVYIDTTLFQTGSSPISDQEQFNTLGWYLINFTYPGNENYTEFEKYLYVNVTANPLAVVSIVYPITGDYEAHFTQLNYTVQYGINCWYDLGEGGGYVVITCGDNITGITSVDDSNTWTIKVENLDGFNTTDSVIFTIDLPIDYSTFTLRMVDVLKICIMLSGLFIIVMAAKSFFLGDSSFGRLFFICVVVGLAVLFILLLGPIVINYISTLIK